MLQLDDKLSELMGVQELPRTGLPEAVGKLLKPLEPLTFTHTIEWVSRLMGVGLGRPTIVVCFLCLNNNCCFLHRLMFA